ncbi:MAG: hypothetical protein ACYCX9_05845, partial [Candidatus Dormibacteria bacterium]
GVRAATHVAQDPKRRRQPWAASRSGKTARPDRVSYGHSAGTVRYWPVPPLGVFYRVLGDRLIIVQVVDVRRLLETP